MLNAIVRELNTRATKLNQCFPQCNDPISALGERSDGDHAGAVRAHAAFSAGPIHFPPRAVTPQHLKFTRDLIARCTHSLLR
jgi:hypothetical protein